MLLERMLIILSRSTPFFSASAMDSPIDSMLAYNSREGAKIVTREVRLWTGE
jgi:hypothetical protein